MSATDAPLRLTLPTPFPVGPVNTWLLLGEPLTLVDAGPDTPEALAALESGLAMHGLRLEDVQLLLLTHQHSDHVGLAGTVAVRSGCSVVAQDALARYVHDTQASLRAEEAWEDELLRLHGTPDDRREEFLEIMRSRHPFGGDGVDVDHVVGDGDVVEAGGEQLRVAFRPGHSPTDTIFVADSGEAFVGDHLIAHISSNPLVHLPVDGPADARRRASPVARYLDSLGRTAAEDLTALHTGHGAEIRDHRPLVEERTTLHRERAEQVAAALRDGERTAASLSEELWPGIAVNQTYLTLCEILGALDLLEGDGRVAHEERDGTVVYGAALC
jgi:glyoxylase-like metal-dependent hydrolase (beta-lactamase superfamily II)